MEPFCNSSLECLRWPLHHPALPLQMGIGAGEVICALSWYFHHWSTIVSECLLVGQLCILLIFLSPVPSMISGIQKILRKGFLVEWISEWAHSHSLPHRVVVSLKCLVRGLTNSKYLINLTLYNLSPACPDANLPSPQAIHTPSTSSICLST